MTGDLPGGEAGAGETPHPGGRRRGIAVALAVSLAFHALLLLLPQRDVRLESRRTMVEMTLAHPERRSAPTKEEPAPAKTGEPALGEVAEAAGPTTAALEATRTRNAPRRPRALPQEVSGREGDLVPMNPSVAEASPMAPPTGQSAADPLSEDPVEPVIDLFPGDVLAGIGPEPAPAAADPGKTLHSMPERDPDARADMAERRIARYVRDQQATHRVETGLIDPYFIRLRDSFADEFDPEWEDFDKSAGEGLFADLAAWLRDHQEVMDRYGASGSPYRKGETSSVSPHDYSAHPFASPGTMAPSDSRRDLAENQMMATLFLDIARGKAGGIEIVAVLRVTQSPGGVLLRVDIERSSGRSEYDDLAKESIRSALSNPRLPERAGEGLGLTGERIETLWAFRTRFVVAPPMPMVACEFDFDGSGECIRPLQRRVVPKVELQAVY